MDDRTLAKLGRACRVLRELSGLSRARLASLSAIHPNTLLRLEAGLTIPTEPTLARIAESLGVTLSTLERIAPHLDDRGRLSAVALFSWIDSESRQKDAPLLADSPAQHLLGDVVSALDEHAQIDVLAYALSKRQQHGEGST